MSGSRLVVVMRTSVGRGLGRETTPAGLEKQQPPPDRRDAIAQGGRVAAAYVLLSVDRFGRDEQDVARVVRRRRLARCCSCFPLCLVVGGGHRAPLVSPPSRQEPRAAR